MKKKCPDCNVNLIGGFRRDLHQRVPLPKYQEAWIKWGTEERTFWQKLTRKDNSIPVDTYACPQCLRLISYLSELP